MPSNIEKSKYHLVACVKDTSEESGSGHISVAVVEKSSHESMVSHTSFYPGHLGSFLNGITMGSWPVPGNMATDHREDLWDSHRIYHREITAEQYMRAKAAQEQFTNDVKNGNRVYSVFGTLNPLTRLFSGIYGSSISASLTAQRVYKENHYIPEDMCDIPVYANNSHVKFQVIPDNCSSAVTHILHNAGFSFKNPHVPSFFGREFEQHGFEKVTHDDAKRLGL